jgi:hypothetical protein
MMMRSLLAVGVLALGAVAVNAQDTASPQERWAQVAACAAERSNESRHACVDAVLRAAGALDAVTETRVNRENFGRVERLTPPPPVAQPPSAPAEAAARPDPIAPPAPVDGVSTQVASARMGNDRRLVVETVEGAIWRQVDSDVIRRLPRQGEAFDVREGALGSFRCTVNRSTTFRCERRD